jgi:hypothetical protein
MTTCIGAVAAASGWVPTPAGPLWRQRPQAHIIVRNTGVQLFVKGLRRR